MAYNVKPHGEREVLLERPGRARQRCQDAKDESHPDDTPDIIVSPVGQFVVQVDVAHSEAHLHIVRTRSIGFGLSRLSDTTRNFLVIHTQLTLHAS